MVPPVSTGPCLHCKCVISLLSSVKPAGGGGGLVLCVREVCCVVTEGRHFRSTCVAVLSLLPPVVEYHVGQPWGKARLQLCVCFPPVPSLYSIPSSSSFSLQPGCCSSPCPSTSIPLLWPEHYLLFSLLPMNLPLPSFFPSLEPPSPFLLSLP